MIAEVRDLILEALTLMDPQTICVCLKHIQEDQSIQFNMRLGEGEYIKSSVN